LIICLSRFLERAVSNVRFWATGGAVNMFVYPAIVLEMGYS